MSEQQAPVPTLTKNQKETARRLGMTEKQYAEGVAAQIKSGKLKREHIT